MSPVRSSATVSTTPTGAKSKTSSGPRPGSGSSGAPASWWAPTSSGVPASPGVSVSSDTIPAEHLLLVGQLARGLDQEAGAADKLCGLFGQDTLVALPLVLLVGGFLVFRLILDDEALLQDDVEARFDVLVLGLLLFLFVLGLAGLLHDRGRGGSEDFYGFDHVLVVLVVHDDIHVEGVVHLDVLQGVLVKIDLQVIIFEGLVGV